VLLLSGATIAQSSTLWGSLKPGSYQVGFSVINNLDTSRQIASSNQPRPIQISLWYPAHHSTNNSHLTYRDYLLLSAHEINFEYVSVKDENATLQQYIELLKSNDIPDSAIFEWLDVRMFASAEAEPETGLFPLIIIAQGNMQSAHHQAILSEYLASYGYVVATCPSPMRISGSITDTSQILSYAQEQASDMKFIFKTLKEHPNIDPARIGLIGHSFGARAALLMLNDLNGIDAFVSLDGGIANRFGKYWLNRLHSFNPESITVPILHFYEDVEDFAVPDFYLLETLNSAPRYLIKIDGMRHLYFTSLGMVTATISGFAPATVKKEVIKQNYEGLCRYTRKFLDAFLNDDREKQKTLFNGSGQETLPESFQVIQMLSLRK